MGCMEACKTYVREEKYSPIISKENGNLVSKNEFNHLRRFTKNFEGNLSHGKFASSLVKMDSNNRISLISDLQQTRGNQYVKRILGRAKLKISEPGDIYEQEADRVAEQVMRMPEHVVQRKCPGDKNKKGLVQLKTDGSSGGKVSAPDNLVSVLGPGQPLDAETRAFMEPRFGQDFGKVRTHSDSNVALIAKALNAEAFTIGRDMVFGAGQYTPNTTEGKNLLAHELTHVVQQRHNKIEHGIIFRSPEEPTKKEIQQDEFLHDLAKDPKEALNEWRNLKKAEQTVLITYMAINYDTTFAQKFLENASRRTAPEIITEITNIQSNTPEKLISAGYRLSHISRGVVRTEYWVHPSGNEKWIIRSADLPVTGSKTKGVPNDMDILPTCNDPEICYGRIIADVENITIGSDTGQGLLFGNGNIELVKKDGKIITFVRKGGGYRKYDENLRGVQSLEIDAENIFQVSIPFK